MIFFKIKSKPLRHLILVEGTLWAILLEKHHLGNTDFATAQLLIFLVVKVEKWDRWSLKASPGVFFSILLFSMFPSTSELPQSEQPSTFSMCASPDFFNSITCSSLDPVGPLLLSLCCLPQGPYSLTPSTPAITWVRTAPRSTASASIFLYHYAQDPTPGSLTSVLTKPKPLGIICSHVRKEERG